MTLREMIEKEMKINGYSFLAKGKSGKEAECWCQFPELMVCKQPFLSCRPGYVQKQEDGTELSFVAIPKPARFGGPPDDRLEED